MRIAEIIIKKIGVSKIIPVGSFPDSVIGRKLTEKKFKSLGVVHGSTFTNKITNLPMTLQYIP
jgi:hypothetical protein